MSAFETETISFPLMSKLPPNCGVVSPTKSVVIPDKTQYRIFFSKDGSGESVTKGVICVMKGQNFEFAETSFMAFNLNLRPPLDILGDLRGFYMSNEVTTYREWHDGFIISRLINLYRAHGLKVVDLTGHLDTIVSHLSGPQAFDSSFLGNIMIHQKGERKHSEYGNPDPRSNMRYKKLGEIIKHYGPKKIVEVGEWDSQRAIGSCTKALEKHKSVTYILFNDFKLSPCLIKLSFIALAVCNELKLSPCMQTESISQGICLPL